MQSRKRESTGPIVDRSPERKKVKDVKESTNGNMEEVKLTFDWIINWKEIAFLLPGISFRSGYFTMKSQNGKEYKWYIELFPFGQLPQWQDYVSIFLTSWNAETIKTSWSVSVLNKDGQKFYTSSFEDHLYSNKTMSSGFLGFIDRRRENFESLLVNGQLMIRSELKLRELGRIVPVGASWVGGGTIEGEGYEPFLNNQLYSDVKFNFSEATIYAHKIVLAGRSRVFALMLEQRGSDRIQFDMDNISHEVFMELMRFIYTDKVKNLENVAEPLLRAADYYKVDKLKRICSEYILEHVTIDNAVFYLQIACETFSTFLEQRISDFIVKNKELFEQRSEYRIFLQQFPSNAIFGKKFVIPKN